MKRSLTTVLSCVLMASAAQATTYYVDSSVGTSGDGSAGSPWKTLADAATGIDALADDGAGDTIIFVGNGDYGSLAGTPWISARTDYLTLIANTGDTPQLTSAWNTSAVSISCATATEIYLVIDGFSIAMDDPSPLPADDGEWHDGTGTVFSAVNAGHLTLKNCEVQGCSTSNYFTQDLVWFTSCTNLLVDGNVFHSALGGTNYGSCSDFTISNNDISDLTLKGGIRITEHAYGTWAVTDNSVHDCVSSVDDPWFPHNHNNSSEWHPSADIYLKAPTGTPATSEWTAGTIARNKMYRTTGAGGESLYLHESYYPKDNLVIENNLLWNAAAIRIRGIYPDPARPTIIRNNTVTGGIATTSCAATSLVNRYWSVVTLTVAPTYSGDGEGLYFINNLMLGESTTSSSYWPTTLVAFVQDYNLWSCPGYYGTVLSWDGVHTKWALWNSSPTTTVLAGYPDLFELTGCNVTTPQYDAAALAANTASFKPFFANAVLNDSVVGEDYHLTANATLAIDAGTATNGATTDIEGNTRDATPDIGCYEFYSSLMPGASSVPSPADDATGVSVTADLSWTAGSDAVSHNVYFGDGNPPAYIGNQSAASYDPGTLAENTTYYWRVDEVGAAGTTAGGVWSFTTGEAPAKFFLLLK